MITGSKILLSNNVIIHYNKVENEVRSISGEILHVDSSLGIYYADHIISVDLSARNAQSGDKGGSGVSFNYPYSINIQRWLDMSKLLFHIEWRNNGNPNDLTTIPGLDIVYYE